jgi:hypothetical protein
VNTNKIEGAAKIEHLGRIGIPGSENIDGTVVND